MAKMFYTLDEAAAKLGASEQEVKDMAADGKLQQFRDRDKLMFKCAEIDAMSGDADVNAESAGPIPLADSQVDEISLSDTAIPLMSDTNADTGISFDPNNDSTGISVFDAGEVEPADPWLKLR